MAESSANSGQSGIRGHAVQGLEDFDVDAAYAGDMNSREIVDRPRGGRREKTRVIREPDEVDIAIESEFGSFDENRRQMSMIRKRQSELLDELASAGGKDDLDRIKMQREMLRDMEVQTRNALKLFNRGKLEEDQAVNKVRIEIVDITMDGRQTLVAEGSL